MTIEHPPSALPPPPPWGATLPPPPTADAHPPTPLAPPAGKLKGDAARAACLAVPYLGPEPAPSRLPGRILLGIVAAILVLRFTTAALFVEQSQRLRDIGEGTAAPGTIDALDRSDSLLGAVGGLHLLLLVASIICWFTWRALRRPKAVVARDGEAYVESPLRWVRGTANRWWLGVCVGAGFVANSIARSAADPSSFVAPTPEALATSRMWSAASSLLFAAAWISWALVVRRSESLLAERIALSPAHRAGWVATPHYLAVPKADSDGWDTERSEGVGWVFRTAALICVLLVAPLFAMGGFAVMVDGSALGLPWFLAGAAGTALAVRALVRRRAARKAPVPAALAPF